LAVQSGIDGKGPRTVFRLDLSGFRVKLRVIELHLRQGDRDYWGARFFLGCPFNSDQCRSFLFVALGAVRLVA